MKGCNVSLLKDTMVQPYTFWKVYKQTNKVKGKCLCGFYIEDLKAIAESKEERQDTYVTRVEGWSKEGLMSFTD
jgi:hypothetical protein